MFIALASVLVALVYNGVQARNTARQLDQNQRTFQLSSEAEGFARFMEMNDRILDAGDEMNRIALLYDRHPSDSNQLKLLNAITPLEGVVFAPKGGVLPSGTYRLWTKYLACYYRLAEGALGAGLADWVPTLASFAARHPVPANLCPVRPD